jgi:hypothetical protein
MPAKRRTELPLGDLGFDNLIWNPFFDTDVQAVLATRKEINQIEPKFPKPGTNSFLRAWPIIAYKEIIRIAYWPARDAYENTWFFDYYNWDSDFIASLLLAVTRYKDVPVIKWDLRRALVECHRWAEAETHYKTLQDLHRAAARFKPFSNEWREFMRCVNESPNGGYTIKNHHRISLRDIPAEGLATERLCDFKELEEMINAGLPHLKSSSTRAENLRRGVFYKENKHRKKIHKDWQENFDAHERWQTLPEDLTLLPCLPKAEYYQNPVEQIRHETASKK